jgi:hypothetical protein
LKKQQYEKLYYQLFLNQTKDIPMDLIEEVQYLTMRLQFINPVYLPVMTESFLCKEFDFAEYLARVHSQTVTDFLNMHFIAMIVSLPVLAFFLISVTAPDVIMNFLNMDSFKDAWVLTITPLVILASILCVFQKVKCDQTQILKQLVPQIMLPER